MQCVRILGRSERRGEVYAVSYVEPLLREMRTKLADVFNILLFHEIELDA